MALTSYKYQREQFEEEVATLRERVVGSFASTELATSRINASAFAESTKTIWDQIKENKDLDLPLHNVMVAEVRCNKIYREKLQNFCHNTSWIKIKNGVESGAVVQGFGKIVSSLIDTYLFEYDMQTLYFDEAGRLAKKELLNEQMLRVIEPSYLSLLERLRNATAENFKAIKDGLKTKRKKKRLVEVVLYQTNHFLNEIHNQFEDAAVKQASWNPATTQCERLRQEMVVFEGYMLEIINVNRKI